MMLDRLRFVLASPFFVAGFFLIFASGVVMCGFKASCAYLQQVNEMLGADDAPFC